MLRLGDEHAVRQHWQHSFLAVADSIPLLAAQRDNAVDYSIRRSFEHHNVEMHLLGGIGGHVEIDTIL